MMVNLLYLLNKAIGAGKVRFYCWYSSVWVRFLFRCNNIKCMGGVKSSGIPLLHTSLHAHCTIGHNFTMGNWPRLNASGLSAKCKIEVRGQGVLEIGNNVGMTATTIMCHRQIKIDDNVKIGVGTMIYDTDFHNLAPHARLNGDDVRTIKTAPVTIEKNAFIGAYCIILKGVNIGENSIVGAGSVVTKDIPKNEIWAGNPAKFIKKLGNA